MRRVNPEFNSHYAKAQGQRNGFVELHSTENPAHKTRGDSNYSRQLWRLLNFFDHSEAVRSTIVLERKVNGAVCYYLDCRPPTPEEISQARHLIFEALTGVQPDEKIKIDDQIGKLIDEYDPFGQLGRKLISIRVPEDPSKPLSAWIYPTDNVENELERLFGGQQISAPTDMQFYVTDKSNNLFRFRSLIQQPTSE